MAAPSSPPVLNGTSVPSTVHPVSPAREWSRTGEPGSAFSGLSRGRGRGRGSASGRGGRGGRSGRGRGSGDSSNDNSTSLKIEAPPIRIVAPPSPASRTPSRRKRRSYQHNKPSNPAATKLTVPDSKPARARKTRSGPSSPNLPSKDIPPHLNSSAGPETTTFDMRTDIDALVERVRAVAMAENSPTTPGIHIDWAGDEDDTLPDLDDWGVATGVSVDVDLGDTVSPISVDGLTPLPEPTEPSQVPREHPAPFPQKLIAAASGQPKAPLHPSLPPKPVTSAEMSAQSRPRPGALSIRAPMPVDPSTVAAKSFMKVADPVITLVPDAPKPTSEEQDTESPQKQQSAPLQRVEGKGLDASIHAPKSFPESSSAPSYFSSNLAPTVPHAFHPTHNRSRTLGRSPDTAPTTSFPSMVSRSGTVTPRGRFSPQMNHHTRTHSSPTISTMNPRPHHAARPVITGDAIARLAKTVCNASGSSPRSNIANSQE